MPQSLYESPPAKGFGAVAAYLARRAAAYVVDLLLLAAAVVLTQGAVRLAGVGLPADAPGLQIEAWILATVSLPIWLYFITLEHSSAGATLGKRLLRLRVERARGGRPSWGQAALRTLLKLLPWELTHLTLMLPVPMWSDPNPSFRFGLFVVSALLGLYLLTAALTPRRQSVHDLAAGTAVVVT